MDEGSIYTAFGKAIAERRRAINKTQDRMASEMGLSRASLANIERGKQRVFLHQVLAMAEALELSSAHEIVPTRLVQSNACSKVDVTTSGAVVSDAQLSMINNIVNSVSSFSDRADK